MSVSFGCFSRSADVDKSRGSNAILCPLELLSYEVSGVLSSAAPFFGAGDETRSTSSFVGSVEEEGAAPRRRVRPDEAIVDAMKVREHLELPRKLV